MEPTTTTHSPSSSTGGRASTCESRSGDGRSALRALPLLLVLLWDRRPCPAFSAWPPLSRADPGCPRVQPPPSSSFFLLGGTSTASGTLTFSAATRPSTRGTATPRRERAPTFFCLLRRGSPLLTAADVSRPRLAASLAACTCLRASTLDRRSWMPWCSRRSSCASPRAPSSTTRWASTRSTSRSCWATTRSAVLQFTDQFTDRPNQWPAKLTFWPLIARVCLSSLAGGRLELAPCSLSRRPAWPLLTLLPACCAQVLPMNTGVEGGETAIKLARRWGYDVKV